MRGSMHELSKQFLRPSSPSGSQKSSRYKQKNIYYLFATSAVLSVHRTSSCLSFLQSFLSGPRTPPDQRSQTNQIPQLADQRIEEQRNEPGQSRVQTPETPPGARRSTETEAAPRTPTTSSPESLTRSSSRSPPIVTRPRGSPGPASTAPT